MTTYTEAQVAEMIEMYNPEDNTSVDFIAASLGKTVASVRAKLVAEGVYVKTVTTKKAKGLTKTQLVDKYIELTGLPQMHHDALLKTTRSVLDFMVHREFALREAEEYIAERS